MIQEAAQSPAALQERNPLVLIVEDEQITRNALDRWLTGRQFRVRTAVNCATALRCAIDDPPDVILLDVKLLGGDNGLQLPKSLAAVGMSTPFVVFTGSAGPRDGFEARQLGAFAIIEKPALPDEIARVLRDAAASRAENDSASGQGAFHEDLHVDYGRRAAAYIERNYSIKQLSVARIASELNISRDHLGRIFRHQFRCSVLTYVHRTRHRHAKRLLAGSEMSIKEISDICGYREPSAFARTFARFVGCSPSEFRARQVQS